MNTKTKTKTKTELLGMGIKELEDFMESVGESRYRGARCTVGFIKRRLIPFMR